jgi:Flp pilus assembly protein CpaB
VAAAGALAAYEMSAGGFLQPQQAGFVAWPASSVLEDFFSTLNGIGWPKRIDLD